MKKLINAIPFVLLLALCPLFYYAQPNLAQAIIVAAISGLCAYQYYLFSQITPDYIELFEQRFENLERITEHKLEEFSGKVVALREDISKKDIAEKTKAKSPVFKF